MSGTQTQVDLNLENYELFDILHLYGLPYDLLIITLDKQ